MVTDSRAAGKREKDGGIFDLSKRKIHQGSPAQANWSGKGYDFLFSSQGAERENI
jgi:hypothetical protein